MEQGPMNIRYLLWKKGVKYDKWEVKLSKWLGCSLRRAEDLLDGQREGLTPLEKKALANVTRVGVKDLSEDLIVKDEVNILAENIRFLLNSIPHGEKKMFASMLGVDTTTVSRWIKGAQRPTNRKLGLIGEYFGLLPGINFAKEPIFLWREPVGYIQVRTWVTECIRQLDKKTLMEIFPALRRILKK